MVDNTRISSIAMSIIGGIMLYFMGNPMAIQAMMGEYYYALYGFIVIAIIGIVYNVLFAGTDNPQ